MAQFAPKLIATMKSALDSAADELDVESTTKGEMVQAILKSASEGVSSHHELKETAKKTAKSR